MKRTIYFDMDGTFANLYGVENWLEDLINHNERPYREAKPLFRMCDFARAIHKCQANGYEVGVISWLAKNSNEEYDERVANAKMEWLATHLPSVQFDVIHIVEYGTPKQMFGNIQDYLFDDEKPNRENWCGEAFDVNAILEVMKELV